MMELKSILVCHTLLRYDTLLSLPAVVYVCGLFQRRHSGKIKHRAYRGRRQRKSANWKIMFIFIAPLILTVEITVSLTGQHYPERELFSQFSINKPRLTSLQMLRHLPPFYLTMNLHCLEKEHSKNINAFRG